MYPCLVTLIVLKQTLGWLECDKNLMVARSVIATCDDRDVKVKYEKFPVWAALIEHPTEGKILFNLGCHPDGMKGPQKVRQYF